MVVCQLVLCVVVGLGVAAVVSVPLDLLSIRPLFVFEQNRDLYALLLQTRYHPVNTTLHKKVTLSVVGWWETNEEGRHGHQHLVGSSFEQDSSDHLSHFSLLAHLSNKQLLRRHAEIPVVFFILFHRPLCVCVCVHIENGSLEARLAVSARVETFNLLDTQIPLLVEIRDSLSPPRPVVNWSGRWIIMLSLLSAFRKATLERLEQERISSEIEISKSGADPFHLLRASSSSCCSIFCSVSNGSVPGFKGTKVKQRCILSFLPTMQRDHQSVQCGRNLALKKCVYETVSSSTS